MTPDSKQKSWLQSKGHDFEAKSDDSEATGYDFIWCYNDYIMKLKYLWMMGTFLGWFWDVWGICVGLFWDDVGIISALFWHHFKTNSKSSEYN